MAVGEYWEVLRRGHDMVQFFILVLLAFALYDILEGI
jgi:hypothetical protein